MPGPSAMFARLLVPALALGTVASQLLLRSLDDNRLTSWRWAFAEVHPARLCALVAGGCVLAVLAARSPLPGRRPGAVLFLSSCAVAALFWGEPEVLVDAARYFTQAKHLATYGLRHFSTEWGGEIQAWTDLPLVPLLHGLAFALLGESRALVQVINTLLFAGSVVLTWRIGEALWDEEVGFLAGALLLGIPYLLTQVPAMLVDVPSMFFLTLAVFAVVRAFERGGAARILLASLAVLLALFSKYSTWLLLSVLPVAGVVCGRGGARRPLRTGLAIALLSGSLATAAALPFRKVYAEQIALLFHYQAPGLRRWGESFTSIFLFQVHPFLTAAALLSLGLAIRRRDARLAVVAWPVLLLLALVVKRTRYWVPALPMLALMAAYGLQVLRGREARRLVAACAVASSLVVALAGYLPFLKSTSAANLQAAGEYLDSIAEERVEVYALARGDAEVNPAVSVPILDLFTRKKVTAWHPEAAAPARRGAQDSALRFTWEYRTPRYYAADGAPGTAAAVVISDDLEEPLPEAVKTRLEGRRLARVFAADEGVFRHRTLVRVYRRDVP